MKCFNCIYWDDEYQECEVGSKKDGCESFQEVLNMNDIEFLDDVVED